MKRLTLAQKVIFAFLVVVIPITVLLFYSTNYSMGVIRDQVSLSNRNLLSTYMRQVDMELDSLDQYLYKTVSDVQPQLGNRRKDTDSVDYILALYGVMQDLAKDIAAYPYVSALFLYDIEEDRVIQTPNAYLQDVDICRNGFLAKLADHGNNPPWSVFEDESGYVLLVRMVKINRFLYIGAYVNIYNIMPNNMQFESYTEFAMTDQTGNVLMGSGKKKLFSAVGRQEADSQWYTVAMDDGADHIKYLVVQAASGIAPISLKIAIPEKKMLNALVNLQQLNFLTPVIIIVVLMLYVVLLRRAVIWPVGQVKQAMDRIGEGDWDTRLPEDMSSEFHQIAVGFNEMAEHIHDLKITMYDEKLKAERAEYNQLQMQINPHFYMNSLNIIYNMAVLRDFENVQKLSLYLANHFKYIIKNTSQTVPLEDELANTKNYLEINRLRFGDILSYQISITPVYNSYRIPMLTIQTFVENSVQHGFIHRDRPFEISVVVRPWPLDAARFYEIIIKDTGVGFSEEYLRKFRSVDFLNQADGHIGLRNTVARLKLRYGEDFKISLENSREGGAEVRLVLPQNLEQAQSDLSESGEVI